MINRLLFILLILSVFLLITGCAGTSPAEQKKEAQEEEDKKKDDEKDFSEIIKDYKPITGLFTIYYNVVDGKAYLEIKPEQLDKVFLCSVTRESGDGTYFDSGALEDNFPFFFRKVNKRIQWIHKNVLFRADRDKPLFRAVEKGVSDSLVSSANIASKPHPKTGAILVPLRDFLIFDRYNLSQRLNDATKSDFSLDKDNSFFSLLKSFPENTDIEIAFHLRSNKSAHTTTLADGRSMFIRYYYSISSLPENNYVSRLADDRVGHFITMFQDYSSLKPETPYVRYIQRWHLEKQDSSALLSPPKKPIVFYLERTIPVEYREAVKSGVLMWNKAFERIGFKDAIVVRQQEDDAKWDPADVRYNTIRWMVKPGAGYAVGPSHANPFTGELYSADIRISADMVRANYTEFEEVVNPLTQHCNYAYGLLHQASFAFSVLQARGYLEGKEEEAEKFVCDYLSDLIAHEVGHTLGLRHNFKASSVRQIKALHNKTLTTEYGITGSVMDYNPANISPDSSKQGNFWQTTLGEYDYWAIEYAYKPLSAKTPEEELVQLKEIASAGTRPELSYGTDEDCSYNSPRSIDPTCNVWDLGNDPLEYAKTRLSLADEVWGRIETKFSKPGERYQKMRRIFRQGLQEYALAGTIACKFIGGIYHRRDHIGDPLGKIPFEPVPAEKQQQALDFIMNNIFSLNSTSLPDSRVLNKLAQERLPDFSGAPWNTPSIDPQIHNSILSIQASVLNHLYDPIVLHRLNDIILRYSKDEPRFGLGDLFNNFREGIWKELENEENINTFRRQLQRAHLEKLVQIYQSPAGEHVRPAGYPSDAISLSYNDLLALRDKIMMVLGMAAFDNSTKMYLEEILARIKTVLEWKNK
ncbi:MAG: zinc-dependent metalloprotease [Planctomycetota bacterium]|nr:zinc-dependent metalloprotease [Planctomycetota bacterium]MDI6787263.1 zinc-dependent metalloprotease [Planctomycetota bacterium]